MTRLILLLTITATALFSSNIDITELKKSHPERIYSKDGEIYSPRSDIYIGISLDNRNFTAEQIEVRNRSSHALNLYDIKGKVGDSLRYTVDDKAPIITIYTGEKRVTKHSLFPAGVFTLLAKDSGSGVQQSYYTINSNPPIAFNDEANITLDVQNSYNISITSIDNVGNIAQEENYSITIDPVAPKSHIKFTNSYTTKDGLTVVGNRSFATISVNDSYGDIKNTFYKISQDLFQSYTESVNLYPLNEGNYTATFYSIDKAGNIESLQNADFFFDSSAPESSLEISQAFSKDKRVYVPNKATLSIKAKDNIAVKDSFITIKDIKYEILEPMPLDRYFQDKNSIEISYNSSDFVGNSEKAKTKRLYLDSEAPNVFINSNDNFIIENNTIYTLENNSIELSAKDSLSGVDTIYYKLDNNLQQEYQDALSLDKSIKSISLSALDNVGNLSKEKFYHIIIDQSPPSIEYYFSYQGLEAKPIESNATTNTYYKDTTIYIKANDNQSGADKILFQINDGRELEYIKPLQFKRNGLYNMKITAIDKLGNRTTQRDIVVIKELR